MLDEPNAHLDADGEGALAHALATLNAEGCTIVLIAHRLCPIAHVDRVIVLSHGELQLTGRARACSAGQDRAGPLDRARADGGTRPMKRDFGPRGARARPGRCGRAG